MIGKGTGCTLAHDLKCMDNGRYPVVRNGSKMYLRFEAMTGHEISYLIGWLDCEIEHAAPLHLHRLKMAAAKIETLRASSKIRAWK